MSACAPGRFPADVQARIDLTASCRDSDPIHKVPDAGAVAERSGVAVQAMHDGTLVLADGYCGAWMTKLIRRLRGHHEPQEELIFHHLVQRARPGSLMVELGAWWAYYTNWWLGSVPGAAAVCVEPDPDRAALGRMNLALNGRTAGWIAAAVGGEYLPGIDDPRLPRGGEVAIECLDMPSLCSRLGSEAIELLHLDIQGAELPFLRSLSRASRHPRFVMVSTHHESISGSASTHDSCIAELRSQGAVILVEHDVMESYSGDGLVAASFEARDADIRLPDISRHRGINPLWAASGEACTAASSAGWLRRTWHRAAAIYGRWPGRGPA